MSKITGSYNQLHDATSSHTLQVLIKYTLLLNVTVQIRTMSQITKDTPRPEHMIFSLELSPLIFFGARILLLYAHPHLGFIIQLWKVTSISVNLFRRSCPYEKYGRADGQGESCKPFSKLWLQGVKGQIKDFDLKYCGLLTFNLTCCMDYFK